jgi:glucans biosynthesis protein C
LDNRRYYGLDALRGGMMLLGIVIHGVGFYLVSPPPHVPLFLDPARTFAADILFAFVHSFRMPTFFVLAGFFAALLVEKRTVPGMLRDRAARILLPLVLAVPLVLVPTLILIVDFGIGVRFGLHEWLPQRALARQMGDEMVAAGFQSGFPLLHLWFLYYLCFFYLAVPAFHALTRLTARHEAGVMAFLTSARAPLVFVILTCGTLWPYKGAIVMEGFLFLTPHGPSLLYYGSFFLLGYVFQHHRAVLPMLARRAPHAALIAAILFPAAYVATHLEYQSSNATSFHALAVVANAACTWALIYAFIGGALRLFDRPSPWALYASQSAYWVYLVHMPLVTLAAFVLLPYDAPGLAKALAAMAFTAFVSFVTYHYLVQRSWVSRLLHGKRFDMDWPWRPRPVEPEGIAGAPR